MRKFLFSLIAGVFLLTGCTTDQENSIEKTVDFTQREVSISDYPHPVHKMTIGMIGDVLLHNPLYTYDDYTDAFADVKETMTEIDFLLANQESMPGGESFGYSGYPAFNSPKHIIGGLQDAGVDMLSIANNHTLDRGEKGTLAAIENIKSYDMPYVGAYSSEEDQVKPRIFTVNQITFGILAYTYGTNGIPTPEGKDYLVARIDPERISHEVKQLKEQTDVVIVSMHWGSEYQLTRNDEQVDLAQIIADAGGDIIFGHHPHVLQQVERLENIDGHDRVVYYSLGNFYSGQNFEYTDIGGIARLTIVKDPNNKEQPIQLKDETFFPTAVVKDADDKFKVTQLKDISHGNNITNEWVLEHMNVIESD